MSFLPFRHFQPQRLGGAFVLHLEPGLLAQVAERLADFSAARPAPDARVFLLSDARAGDSRWHPFAEELAENLRQRGIRVWQGKFCLEHGRIALEQNSGEGYFLHELEAHRHALLLCLSDGEGLKKPRARFALEELRHWPRCVWLELRDERAWDEWSALPARLGLPVYPASGNGLLQALDEVLRKPRAALDHARQARAWQGFELTRHLATRVSVTVERILGDAKPWAQACAMLPPPLGLGLADSLRRRFFAHLPASRLNRLLALPGARQADGGLVFSAELLAILRGGFARQDLPAQEKILDYLWETVQAAEPEKKNTPAYREWAWYLARLHLEIDPDQALGYLPKLLAEPDLDARIRADLAEVCLPLDRGAQIYRQIPLRRKPEKRRHLRLLAQLAPHSGIGPAEITPVRYHLHYWLDTLHSRLRRARRVAAFSPDGRWIIEAEARRHARVWRTRDGSQRHLLPARFQDIFGQAEQPWLAWLQSLGDASSLVAEFSPDGRRMLTVLNDNTVRIWDTESADILYVLKGYRIWLRGAGFSPDSGRVVAITANGELWDIARGRLLRRLSGHERFIFSATLSPDGERVATAACDGTARVWQLDSGETLQVLRGHRGRVYSVSFSPDGRYLLTGGADRRVCLWETERGHCLKTFQGHRGRVSSARFSPDGRWMVSASADRTARLWEVASGEILQVMRGHKTPLNSAVFAPDGRHVLTAGNDCVHIWEADILGAGSTPARTETP